VPSLSKKIAFILFVHDIRWGDLKKTIRIGQFAQLFSNNNRLYKRRI
jgi:hypothetical protein